MSEERSGPEYIRMRNLDPKCCCGEKMTHVNAVWISENMDLIFLGSCDFDCPTNQSVFDIVETVKALKKKKFSDCTEVSSTTGEPLDGKDEFSVSYPPGGEPS